ncbi:Alpha/Beta hydrolase protein [Halenospora varia]|nr:Alpha/Beta hydrolase protein [Halenospora varia]
METRTNIEFNAADGIRLRGWFYRAGEKGPCIIIANGFTGTKEAFLDDFAERFQAAGYAALVYDNRNWGESEGSPRNESDPVAQTRDYLAAFDYAASLPEVDPARIVYWGSSLAGGNVICAAAVDKRIRAVISQVPFVSGEMLDMAMGPKKQGFMLTDRSQLAKGGSSHMIAVIPDSIEEVENGTTQAVLGTPDVFPFLAELDRRNVKWEKYATMQSLFYMQSHEPKAFIGRISPTPLLMVVGEQDLCCPTRMQLAMYAQALEPKKLHVLRGEGHFGPYYGSGFEANIKIQLDFLKEVL